jgi:RecA-family ATPase
MLAVSDEKPAAALGEIPACVVDDARTLSASEVVANRWRQLESSTRLRLRQREAYRPFALTLDGKSYSYPGDDRSQIIWGIGADLRSAGSSPAETLAVVMETCFWRAREADGKREDPLRLIRRLFADGAGRAIENSQGFRSFDPSEWANLPVPQRQWLVQDLIPMRKVTALYGDGGTGKTLLAMQLMVACPLGIPFLGLDVRQGRVYALLAENDIADTHITLDAISRHHGVGLADLKGKIRIAPRAGYDNALMNQGAQAEPLFQQLLADIKGFGPSLVVLDTAADLYAGNENDRVQVNRFVKTICERIAIETGAAVVLCAHPSREGLRTDGSAGSTAWNNAVRSRLYLKRDDDDDPDYRVLELKKANLARTGTTIKLRWRDGVFVRDDDGPRQLLVSEEDERVIAEVESAFNARMPLSAHPQAGGRWLGQWIMTARRKSRKAAKAVVDRLIARGKLVDVEYDLHRHRSGLCTPEQAEKFARERAAMKRTG